MKYIISPLCVAIALAASGNLLAETSTGGDNGTTLLPEVVVTAPAMSDPLTVVTDPKAPRQPVPAHDGADYLKSIPGFAVIRKGGTDGDPVFRGMAGSRLNILLDGESIMGGCGMRMDPPTAYIFPEAFDRLTVLKGPQSVLYGPASAGATVLFERDHQRLAEPGWHGSASLMAGSFGRDDEVVDITGGSPDFQARITGTRSQADDYQDGDGIDVHSQYERWSGNGELAWAPDDDTRVAVSLAQSDGEAAYRDRSMDGAMFARDNVGLRLERVNISPLIRKIEAQLYRNYIDHVMDNYSLRTFTPSMMMANPAASNPDRLTAGARFAAALAPTDALQVSLGVDLQDNTHTTRSTMNETTMPYESMARVDDAEFRNHGVFGEATRAVDDSNRVIAGLRSDHWYAKDARATGATAGTSRSETLGSGFLRHEHDIGAGSTTYVGIGHAERFPDYWELIGQGKESLTTNSAFLTAPEKNTQLDAGWVRNTGSTSVSVSAFYGRTGDYILIDTVSKPGKTITRSVDAVSFGGEASVARALDDHWKADATLAYVRGTNRTDEAPLAQQPPLEARAGLTWDNRVWSAGALLRAVDRQDRVDPGTGNIAGQDLGHSPGFAVFSLNGSWRPAGTHLQLAAGVDNLFDVAYAEHLSRTGMAAISGFTTTTRVNEPGRNLWLKASLAF